MASPKRLQDERPQDRPALPFNRNGLTGTDQLSQFGSGRTMRAPKHANMQDNGSTIQMIS